MFVLELLRDDEVVMVHRVDERPAHIGRAPVNDLILNDPMVSEHHAVFWHRNGKSWVRDLDSSNGTYVNGTKLTAAVELKDGDQIGIGETKLRAGTVKAEAPIERHLVLQDERSGVCLPLLSDRVSVGSDAGNDLILPDTPEHLLTLLVYPDGDLWLGTMDTENAVEVDHPFEVEGRTFIVRRSTGAEQATLVPNTLSRAQYRIEATLQGATGPSALVVEQTSNTEHRIDAENRAILLYLLARAVQEDQAEGKSADELGWRTDEELRRGIWGRTSRENQLNVLLHRLRGELRTAGIDPWFIEKKRRYTRARVAKVTVT